MIGLHFSVFEVTMLVCFGLSWPFSIYRTYKARNVEAKSPVFLVLVVIGYVAGVVHKLLYSRDAAVLLYAANAVMVTVDLLLVVRNRNTVNETNNKINLPFASRDRIPMRRRSSHLP